MTISDLPSRAQRWDDCDADVRAWVEAIADVFRDELGASLVGIYLHGSLATGCYHRPKSDADLLIVVREALTDAARWRLGRRLLALADARPTVGTLELSVIREEDARPFRHPLPYEFHFGEGVAAQIRDGTYAHPSGAADGDLGAHVIVARSRGVTLEGPPAAEVFGPVPWAVFADSVLSDFTWIVEDDHVLESPFYAVLNACRTIQLLREPEGTVANKEEGALWALDHLPPEHRPVIEAALACYRSGAPVTPETRKTGGREWDAAALRAFRDFAAAEAAALAPKRGIHFPVL
jgi:predicted nucleotidyltransferase